jgi:hypothetical protein
MAGPRTAGTTGRPIPRAGIDPRRKLIERGRDDNVVEVKAGLEPSIRSHTGGTSMTFQRATAADEMFATPWPGEFPATCQVRPTD